MYKINSKAVFLQGKLIDRVFLKHPEEAKTQGQLWKLRKVSAMLHECKMEFGKVLGIIIVHAHDLLRAGSAEFVEQVIVAVREIFKISKKLDTVFENM